MTHLHLHSQYSVIDGRGLINDYVELAAADGQEAMALTDHGTLGGIIDGYQACKKAGIKLIPGCEIYVDVAELRERNFPGHLTVLAKNEQGYRALIAANNLAHRQFYYRPRLTIRQIIDNGFASDWVILSGCMSSPIFDVPYAESEVLVRELAKASGSFFLEAMWHYSKDATFDAKQTIYLEHVSALSKATGIPVVLTNDCHYARMRDENIHAELLSGSRQPSELEFDGLGFHFKTIQQMQSIAQSLGCYNAVDNAVQVGKLCDVSIPEADTINWYVPDITGGVAGAKVIRLCEAMLQARELPNEYWERYRYEYSVLATSPSILNSYLVAHDVVTWCAERNIAVAARGSMAGSLVSWLLGITEEDPIKYNLSFSRAVNPARPTIPDFDLDVSSFRRAEVLEYLAQRYTGNIPICAYTHYGPKGALRKILNMEGLRSPGEINELSKKLPDDWSDGDFAYSASAKRYVGMKPWTELVPENYQTFMKLYDGFYSSVSAHPSGVLISGPERELEHEVPLQWIASSKTLASAYDMYTLKKVGLFKLDVLGLRTLDQLQYMEKATNAKLPNDDYDEPEVLAAFGADLLAEIFQMDGYACREVIRQIGGITSFEDIIAANTLARPGSSQFTPYYRTGYTNLIRQYPELNDILGVTNGLILYQEQVMEIARVLADFDDAEQDDVKESIKYFNHDNWIKNIEPKFRERCDAKGVDATNILEAISRMASYTYNRAHAMTYAAIAYKMMWYKVHFPAVYYAATFDAADDKQRLVLESHFFDVKWHPADINYSEAFTTARDGEVVLGLSAIKGVGPAVYAAIAAARPYTSLEDFESRVERRKCNKRHIANLKDAFALTSIHENGSFSVFQEAFGFNYHYLDNKLSRQLTEWQDEYPGVRLAGFITDIKEFEIKKAGPNQGKQMCGFDVTNIKGRRRGVLFPDIWRKARGKIYQGAPVKFEGTWQTDGQFIAEKGYQVD